jgi:hypothetical protein
MTTKLTMSGEGRVARFLTRAAKNGGSSSSTNKEKLHAENPRKESNLVVRLGVASGVRNVETLLQRPLVVLWH